MDIVRIAEAVAVVIVGSLLLRVAGRKSLAQTTVAETVVMISIGSILIQPLATESVQTTLLVGFAMVFTTRLLSYLQLRFNYLEQVFTGKAIIIIEKGTLNIPNLSMVGLSVDQLEMQLRQSSVKNISDVEWATIEPNGRIGFILKEHAQPATKEDLNVLASSIEQRLQNLQQTFAEGKNPLQTQAEKTNIFSEVVIDSKQQPENLH